MPFRTPLDLYEERTTALDRRRLLRPMKGGEIIDHAVRLIQLYGMRILPATLGPTALCYLALINYGVFIGPLFFGSRSNDLSGQTTEIASAVVMFFVICLPLIILGVAYSASYTSQIARDYMHGEKVDFPTLTLNTFQNLTTSAATVANVLVRTLFPTAICIAVIVVSGMLTTQNPDNLGLSFLAVGAMTFCGFIAVLAPPFILGALALAPVIGSLEGLSGREAVKRSKFLMKSHGHVVGGHTNLVGAWILILFIGACLLGGLYVALEVLGLGQFASYLTTTGRFGPVFAEAVLNLPGFITLWLLVPLYSAIISVLYFDRRVRLEAYDIKVLAKDVLQSSSSSSNA